jgi:hypothetical protein
LLLYLPLIALVWWRGPRLAGLGWLALGFLPLLAWEAFALLYYGFPFPNTAYAKLQTGVGRGELVLAGLRYLASSLSLDPLPLVCLVGAAAVALARRHAASLALVAGLASYVAYTVWIGGDFMSGRFLSPVVFGAALVIARADPERLGSRAWAVGTAALLLTGVAAQAARFGTQDARAVVDDAGVADERRVYAGDLGLLSSLRRDGPPTHPWVQAGLELRSREEPMLQIAGGVGLLGAWATSCASRAWTTSSRSGSGRTASSTRRSRSTATSSSASRAETCSTASGSRRSWPSTSAATTTCSRVICRARPPPARAGARQTDRAERAPPRRVSAARNGCGRGPRSTRGAS